MAHWLWELLLLSVCFSGRLCLIRFQVSVCRISSLQLSKGFSVFSCLQSADHRRQLISHREFSWLLREGGQLSIVHTKQLIRSLIFSGTNKSPMTSPDTWLKY